MNKLQHVPDFGLEVTLEHIDSIYFRVKISANVLGSDGMFDGRRHTWNFYSIKELRIGTFFFGSGKDIRLFKNVRSRPAKESMKKLALLLSQKIAPGRQNLIYTERLIHTMCDEIQKQLTVLSVLKD